MGKAIMGSFGDPRVVSLLEEVRTLRGRVAELEAALEKAESILAEHHVSAADGDTLIVGLDDVEETGQELALDAATPGT